MRIETFALLATVGWALASGVGCGSTPVPVQVPLRCSNNVYHWGARTSVPDIIAFAQVAEDCEWNGLNDFGPLDDDSLDPTDPHFFWEYRVEDGAWTTTNYVWAHDLVEESQAWTWSSLGLVFDGLAGIGYHVVVDSSQSSCVNDATRYHYTLHCPGVEPVTWYSWTGLPHPFITPVTPGECQFEAYSAAFRQGVDPLVPLEECWATNVFRVYR